MKTRVNFYNKHYKPKFKLISLNSVVFLNVLVLGITLAAVGYLYWHNQTLTLKKRAIDNQVNNLQREVDSLQAGLSERTPSANLVNAVEQQKVALADREQLLEELANREATKQNRFSQVLTDLTLADTPQVWLSSFNLKSGHITLRGYGTTADAMPNWLARLSTTESFAGESFEQMTMVRDGSAIRFELNTTIADTTQQGQK